MPFEKGNKLSTGRPKKGTALTDRLRAKMAKKADDLAETLIGKALDGDMAAIKEIFDRMEGKPVQQQILSGDPDAPIQTISNSPLDPEDWALRYGIAANQD